MSGRFACCLAALAMLAQLAGCARDEVKAEFMNGCLQGNTVSKSTCECVFGKLEPNLRAMHKAQRPFMSEALTQRLVQVAALCQRE